MACVIVPTTEAVITTIATKVVKSKEKEHGVEDTMKVPFSTKLGWLNKMLWGGSALLAFEHIWHGEIIPVFPFLTAVEAGEAAGMLHEMATSGVMMSVIVTAVWAGMVAVSNVVEKKTHADNVTAEGSVQA